VRPCLDCGRPTNGSRCDQHEAARQAARADKLDALHQAQEWRRAYGSSKYQKARAMVRIRSGGRCEAINALTGERCPAMAEEAHHIKPLSHAETYEDALALCTPENLADVCRPHNPRGGRP
jgi:hypothetical protein